MDSVAVILPVYNEEWLIGSTFGSVVAYAREHPNWVFRFVDDGSTDDTVAKIEERLEIDNAPPNIELVKRPRNTGKAVVIRESMLAADEDLLLFTDGDLAYPLDLLDLLVEKLEDADVAIGSRALVEETQKNISLLRRTLGGGFNFLVRTLTRVPHHDTQAGLKGFTREAARSLFTRQRVENFAFDAELLFLARRLGLRVAEIPARVSSRHSYKKSTMNLLKDPPRMLASIVRMRLEHRGARWIAPVKAETEIEVLRVAQEQITRGSAAREKAGVGS